MCLEGFPIMHLIFLSKKKTISARTAARLIYAERALSAGSLGLLAFWHEDSAQRRNRCQRGSFIPFGSDTPKLASALLLEGRPPCRPWIATDRTEPVPPNASELAPRFFTPRPSKPLPANGVGGLTHDSIIVQIPHLKRRRQSELECVLGIFDKSPERPLRRAHAQHLGGRLSGEIPWRHPAAHQSDLRACRSRDDGCQGRLSRRTRRHGAHDRRKGCRAG